MATLAVASSRPTACAIICAIRYCIGLLPVTRQLGAQGAGMSLEPGTVSNSAKQPLQRSPDGRGAYPKLPPTLLRQGRDVWEFSPLQKMHRADPRRPAMGCLRGRGQWLS